MPKEKEQPQASRLQQNLANMNSESLYKLANSRHGYAPEARQFALEVLENRQFLPDQVQVLRLQLEAEFSKATDKKFRIHQQSIRTILATIPVGTSCEWQLSTHRYVSIYRFSQSYYQLAFLHYNSGIYPTSLIKVTPQAIIRYPFVSLVGFFFCFILFPAINIWSIDHPVSLFTKQDWLMILLFPVLFVLIQLVLYQRVGLEYHAVLSENFPPKSAVNSDSSLSNPT